jgi:V-type H+-transporting ATPase subunit a
MDHINFILFSSYFRDRMSILCEFIPQIIFMCFLFLYMVLLMFIKWVNYGPQNDVKSGPYCAPSILITFINMVLFKSSKSPEVCDPYMFAGQGALQKLLVIIALLCVPIMLLAKPIMIMRAQKQHQPVSLGVLLVIQI